MNKAVELADKLCETMMKRFAPEELPPGGRWHYHQGVFLWGMYKLYEVTKNEDYYDYIKKYVDHNVMPDGQIPYGCEFDDAMTSVLLFPIYERSGEEKYRYTLDHCAKWIPMFFKTPSGGFWHKFNCVDQMWLDGFYMAQPLCVRYAVTFDTHKQEFFKMAYDQLRLMKEFTRDEKTGLWYHAYDESRKAIWADNETGRSPEFWGRAFGWIGCALVDILELMPADCEYRDYFEDTLRDYVESIIRVQDEKSGIWYQVLNRGDDPENWLETSCSCLFVYTICKGMRLGLLDNKYIENMKRAFEGIKAKLTITDSELLINDICVGTGVGDYEFYLARPTTINDLHGSGAFLHAMSELARIL